MLDGLAALTSGDVPDFERVQTLYQADPRLRMDGTVTSYTGSGPQIIHLAGDS